jgi:hypothetical protein
MGAAGASSLATVTTAQMALEGATEFLQNLIDSKAESGGGLVTVT